MTLRFLHTSDWQLGMTRHYLAGEAQTRFTADRLGTVRALLRLAVDQDCAFVVVAGDVFEHAGLSARDIGRALDALGGAQVPVLLLPGNHDPLGPGSLWASPQLTRDLPSTVTVLDSRGPWPVPGGEVVAAPWSTTHPDHDPVAWALEDLPADGTVRVLVGHGMLEELQPDRDAPDTVRREPLEQALRAGSIHYVALGDRHIRWPLEGDSPIRYSGAHETTSFREPGRGHALVVELDPQGPRPVQVTAHPVGRWEHRTLQRQLDGPEDLRRLGQELRALPDKDTQIVRTALTGGLSVAQAAELDELLEAHRQVLAALFAWERRTELAVLPDPEELEGLQLQGFVRQAVERLLELAEQPPAAAHAEATAAAWAESAQPTSAASAQEDQELLDAQLAAPAAPPPHETAQEALRLLMRLHAQDHR